MKVLDILDIIAKIIIVIGTVVVAYLSLQFIFGNSPDLSQINSMLIGIVVTVLFSITITFMKTFSNLNREIGEIKIGMKHSFIKVKDDMNILKNDMSLIKKKLKI